MDCLKFEEALAKKWKYKKLPKKLSVKLREIYKRNIPADFEINGDNVPIFSSCGTMLAERYDRIVIGDYGAFLEISKKDCIKSNFKNKKGQEYRYNDPNYCDKVKYIWLTAKDDSDVKIYVQKRTVTYADYKPFKVYISVHEAYFAKI